MAPAPSADPEEARDVWSGHTTRAVVRRSLITGTAIVIPLAVTALVLSFALNFLSSNLLGPVAGAIRSTAVFPNSANRITVEILTGILFVVLVFAIGFVAEFTNGGGRLSEEFDQLMASIPGIGSVYTSFDEMSEVLLDDDTESFREVKLVEYPGEGSYVVAFTTADTPPVIEHDAGHDEMETLFMPMAPNPVMGGFVIHVDADRIVDVDMSVEEGIQSIVTSGVTVGEDDERTPSGLSPGEMRELGRTGTIEGRGDSDTEPRAGDGPNGPASAGSGRADDASTRETEGKDP